MMMIKLGYTPQTLRLYDKTRVYSDIHKFSVLVLPKTVKQFSRVPSVCD